MNPAHYTRVVSTLKIVLPLVALGVLSTVFLITADDGFDPVFTFSEADFEALEEGNGLTSPRVSGKTDKGESFNLTADRVEPQSGNLQILIATNMVARIASESGKSVEITSEIALMDLTENMLHLSLGGQLATSDGYFAQIDSMLANLKTGEITGEMIRADGEIGDISADNFRIIVDSTDNAENQVLWFENNVKVTIHIPEQEQ